LKRQTYDICCGTTLVTGESYFVNDISMLDTGYSSLVSSFVFCEHQVSRIEYPELKLFSLSCLRFTIHERPFTILFDFTRPRDIIYLAVNKPG